MMIETKSYTHDDYAKKVMDYARRRYCVPGDTTGTNILSKYDWLVIDLLYVVNHYKIADTCEIIGRIFFTVTRGKKLSAKRQANFLEVPLETIDKLKLSKEFVSSANGARFRRLQKCLTPELRALIPVPT